MSRKQLKCGIKLSMNIAPKITYTIFNPEACRMVTHHFRYQRTPCQLARLYVPGSLECCVYRRIYCNTCFATFL